MALRNIENALPISQERPKKLPKLSKQPEIVLNDENNPVAVPESTVEYIASENLEPFPDPESSVKRLLEELASKDWIKVFESLNNTRRFAVYHSSLLLPILEKLIVVMVKAMKNPRSALCKTSIMTCSDIFIAFGEKLLEGPHLKSMDDLPKGPPGSFFFKGRLIRSFYDDPECCRQQERFFKQFKESGGFDVDWDSFDYVFGIFNFDWQPCLDDDRSNEELMKLLIHAAIKEYDNANDTKLESVKYVSANIVRGKGFLFYITFLAKDLNSPNQEPKPYQAKVWMFCDEIEVSVVRLKPTHHHN